MCERTFIQFHATFTLSKPHHLLTTALWSSPADVAWPPEVGGGTGVDEERGQVPQCLHRMTEQRSGLSRRLGLEQRDCNFSSSPVQGLRLFWPRNSRNRPADRRPAASLYGGRPGGGGAESGESATAGSAPDKGTRAHVRARGSPGGAEPGGAELGPSAKRLFALWV